MRRIGADAGSWKSTVAVPFAVDLRADPTGDGRIARIGSGDHPESKGERVQRIAPLALVVARCGATVESGRKPGATATEAKARRLQWAAPPYRPPGPMVPASPRDITMSALFVGTRRSPSHPPAADERGVPVASAARGCRCLRHVGMKSRRRWWSDSSPRTPTGARRHRCPGRPPSRDT